MQITEGNVDSGKLKSMLRGVFQRGAMAILLVGALVMPSGICQPPTHNAMGKTAHSCCPAATEPGTSLTTDCCIARATLPALVVAPELPGSAAVAVTREFVASNGISLPGRFSTPAIIPPQSPPTGASILRI
jgi:hypothetical protein